MVFTAGCPGSGKSYCLHEIYGLENLVMIDLDVAIQQHQDYDPKDPKRIYSSKVAYEWADQAVERRFQLALREIEHGPRLICVDGTGTHVARQKRRMWAAKKAGFWIVHLYVQVSFETALERNSRRKRRVPDEIIRKYIEELPDAVHSVMEEDGLVDEFIQFNNNREDERTEHERWGQYFRVIQENSSKRETFIDFHVRKDVQQTVRELFDALDTDNDGIISVDELRKVMTEATGTVDAEEIIRAAEIIREGSPDRQLRYQDFVLLVLHDHVNCKLARILHYYQHHKHLNAGRSSSLQSSKRTAVAKVQCGAVFVNSSGGFLCPVYRDSPRHHDGDFSSKRE